MRIISNFDLFLWILEDFVWQKVHTYDVYNIEVERTVRCSRTVRFLVMFGRFEVRFLAKITCSDMFEVRFWWFWKILGPFFINKVREQFGFWWCSRGSKFGFGPKWDVQMCSKFDSLRFGTFQVRFFDVRSTSSFHHKITEMTEVKF